jgi:hypothetical protein
MKTKNEGWQQRWKNWVRPTRIPNVWELRGGGHLMRARVTDPSTGKLKEIKRVMPEADEATAYKWLQDERARVRAGTAMKAPQLTVRFADYAVSLFEKKSGPGGKIRSSAGRMRWRSTLAHLIAGTHGEKAAKRVNGFGEIYIHKLHVTHVEQWRTDMGELIAAGDYAPTTVNSWLAILRVIIKGAKREFGLDHLATDGIEDIDTSEHVVYSEEQPNSLPAERVGEFLEILLRQSPQHYAMAYVGMVTGLRPLSLRPLRRRGLEADVLWEKNRILVRRSQTRGGEVMNTTKQKRRYAIDVPESVMKVLEWHVQTQLDTPEQQASDLLFPSTTGGFRSPNVLNKPFAAAIEAMDLGYTFTQRGMRRTFNDLARHAKIEAIVTRSISGHLTERMQDHYSTVASDEQRTSIAKVIELFSPARADSAEEDADHRA